MLWSRVLLVAACVVCCVVADCDKTVVDEINKLWGKEPPSIDLQQFVGTSTLVWQSSAHITPDTVCSQTELDSDATTARDKDVLKNGTKIVSEEYNFVADPPGVITLTGGDMDDYWAYVVYLDLAHGVFAVFMCDPYGDSDLHVSVAVINYRAQDEDTAKSIEQAKAVLEELGINNGAPVPTQCPSF